MQAPFTSPGPRRRGPGAWAAQGHRTAGVPGVPGVAVCPGREAPPRRPAWGPSSAWPPCPSVPLFPQPAPQAAPPLRPPCTGGVAVPLACRRLGRARQSARVPSFAHPATLEATAPQESLPSECPAEWNPPREAPAGASKQGPIPSAMPASGGHPTQTETSSRTRKCVVGRGMGGSPPWTLPLDGGVQALGLWLSARVSPSCPPPAGSVPLYRTGAGVLAQELQTCTHRRTHTHAQHMHTRTEGPTRAQSPTEAQLGPAHRSPPSWAHPGLPPAPWGQGTAGRRNAAFNFCRITTSTG